MNTAHKGRRFEHCIRDMLRSEGYDVGRFAGSKGGDFHGCDLIGMSAERVPRVLLVSCKRGAWPGREERRQLTRLSRRYPRPGHEIRVYRRRDRGPIEMRLVDAD
mgnify:CR=1 FL=1